MTRAIPQIAIDLVKRLEGFELEAYQDSVGVWTIGYGHTGREVVKGLKITASKALAYLRDDLAVAARRIEDRVGAAVVGALTEHQYAALLSFVFNLGADADWTVWKMLRARKFDNVPPQMMRFINADGRRNQGLVNRRTAEVVMWNTAEILAAPTAPEVKADPAPPSSVTRAVDTPPILSSSAAPLAKSGTLWAGAATAAGGVITGATQVQALVQPHAAESDILAKVAGGLAVAIVALGVAVMVFKWLDERRKRQ